MNCVLTLEIPKAGKHSVAVAATTDREVLITFKHNVLLSYTSAVEKAETRAEKILRQSQLEHMQRILDFLIPEPNKNENREP